MLKKIIKKVIISLLLGISIGLGMFITYAANITEISQFPATGDILTNSWFMDLHDRIVDVHGSGGNVGIGVVTPTQKLDVNGNINATSIKVTCIGNCF